MQDLAGLSILYRILLLCLRSGEIRQNAASNARIEPQALDRSDDTVSAKGRAKPRDTGIRIRTIRRFRPHHVKVGDRAIQPVVELFVYGKDLWFVLFR